MFTTNFISFRGLAPGHETLTRRVNKSGKEGG